jgi:hypothetical protein
VGSTVRRALRRLHHDFVAFPGHPDFPEQPAHEEQLPAFYQQMRDRRFDLALQLHGSGEISNQVVRAFGAAAVASFAPAGDASDDMMLAIAYPMCEAVLGQCLMQ